MSATPEPSSHRYKNTFYEKANDRTMHKQHFCQTCACITVWIGETCTECQSQ